VNNEELRSMARKLANEAHALATPIDLPELRSTGVLKKIGNSYYTDNIHNLPENVSKKISAVAKTRHGFRLTFYKETKSVRGLAEDLKEWRD
jgi:hypothetical protein